MSLVTLAAKTAIPLLLFFAALNGPASPLKPELEPLAYFEGAWKCEGHFQNGDRKIAADINFTASVDGAWLTLRHDDLPPNRFHALEMWGFDSKEKHFVAMIFDNWGSPRSFNSPGWQNEQLVWTGGKSDVQNGASERFVFEKKPQKEFSVRYEVNSGKDQWKMIDILACSRP